jgi:hypothetical protein
VCNYLNNGLVKYSVNTTCGSSPTYNWVINATPAGSVVVVGVNSNHELQVQFAEEFESAVFTVNANFGGTVVSKSINISSVPFTPVISGNVCGSTSVNNTYSVNVAQGVDSYAWSSPYGTSLLSGQGTNSAVLKFGNAFTDGELNVIATNSCGLSSPASINLLRIPNKPNAVNGSTTFCYGTQNGGLNYSIQEVYLATSYIWTVSANASFVSGNTNDSVKVLFGNLYQTGIISVSSVNQCGTSATTTLTVNSTPTNGTSSITGPTNACAYLGNGQIVTYTAAVVSGNNISYNWIAPQAATLVSGQGTNIAGFTFSNNFTSGNIGVQVQDNCGISSVRNLAVSLSTIYAVGQISGPKVVCTNVSTSTNATYSVVAVPGAVSYNWTIPSGVTIVSGVGTNSIAVSFGSNFTSGNLSVAVTTRGDVS